MLIFLYIYLLSETNTQKNTKFNYIFLIHVYKNTLYKYEIYINEYPW